MINLKGPNNMISYKEPLDLLFKTASLFFVVAAVLMAVLAWTSLPVSEPEMVRTLPITTSGSVTAVPDVGRVTFTVMTEGEKTDVIQNENAQKVNAIISFLKEEGVDAEDIKTSQFSLNPRYYYPYQYPRTPCPLYDAAGEMVVCPPLNQVLIGYTLTQSVSVKMRDFDKVGIILAGAVDRGANRVSSLNFSVEDMDEYKKEAREEAVIKAKEQAEDLAKLGEFKIDKVLSIQEGYAYAPTPYYGVAEDMALGAPSKESVTPDIEAGSQEVVVTLTVTFKIK